MRCPYCGGLNQEQAAFCGMCGRDLKRPNPNPQPQRPAPRSTQTSAARPSHTPVQPPASRAPSKPASTPTATSRRQPAMSTPTPAPAPEPPALFPPRTMAQFEALLSTGCQNYTVVESHIENGKKKCLTIAYAPCPNWQQAATLLKALRDNQEEQYATIIIRGLASAQQEVNGFNNGQLQFDRNVLLGSQRNNRYMLETGNGYTADSLRFVLNV